MSKSIYFTYSPYFAEELTPEGFDHVENAFQAAPEKIKNLVIGASTPLFIKSTVDQYKLTQDQGIIIALLIRGLLFGDIYIGNIVQEIQNRMGLDATTAQDVANTIINFIFSSAAEEIRVVQHRAFGGGSAPVVAPRPPQAPVQGNVLDLRNKQ